ncbi:MAG: threonine synthase, partial [Paracoccaceae bacterium]|nr:threonine synthase [Paracoccaceae bacterium]
RSMETGIYEKRGVTPTISPSMDIQVSSNFERLIYELYDEDGSAVSQVMDELAETGRFQLSQGALTRLREGFDSAMADGAASMRMIARVCREGGPVLDPHTAVGVIAAEARRGDPSVPMITLGTAHAAKFPDAVEDACGTRPALPARMTDLYERDERVVTVLNDLAAVEALIRERRA